MILTNHTRSCVCVGIKNRMNFIFLFAVTILNSKTNRSSILPAFYMGVKLGLKYGWRNINYGYLRTEC